jgi:hypothetical protein
MTCDSGTSKSKISPVTRAANILMNYEGNLFFLLFAVAGKRNIAP